MDYERPLEVILICPFQNVGSPQRSIDAYNRLQPGHDIFCSKIYNTIISFKYH